MEHFYKSLTGYFTFPDFYSWVAQQLPTDRPSKMVEIGVASGQSAAYMAVELINRGVPCTIDLVDYFTLGPDFVKNNLKPVANMIGNYHQGPSWDQAVHYEDGSLDFVFIDAGHEYESVKKDINAWRPKVKKGGILAGHDFMNEYPEIIKAVIEEFPYWEVWRGKRWGLKTGQMIDDSSTEEYCICPSWVVRM